MTITTNTTDRKALAKAIAEELGTTARYLGLPSYGYQIGDFTVDHDGNIIGEDFGALQDFLRRNGYVNDEPAADQVTERHRQLHRLLRLLQAHRSRTSHNRRTFSRKHCTRSSKRRKSRRYWMLSCKLAAIFPKRHASLVSAGKSFPTI